MGNFRTEDDYAPYNGGNKPDYNGYDNPEIGNSPDGYGRIKKRGVFSRLSNAFGDMGTGITLEKVLFLIYAVAMIVIVINIQAVLDFLFYITMYLLQYVIMLLVVLALGYILFRYILR